MDYTSVDTRSSDREAATFGRMRALASSYQASQIYQTMLAKTKQSRRRAHKPAIPFKNREPPGGAAKLRVLLRCLNTQKCGANQPPHFYQPPAGCERFTCPAGAPTGTCPGTGWGC